MSETLRDVAVDLAGQLANCEANAACDGPDSWEYRSEYFAEYMDRINAADAERTCQMAEHSDLQPRGWYIHYWECSYCHAHYRDKDMPRFCPSCGARILGGDAS